jgi:ribosomal protein S1
VASLDPDGVELGDEITVKLVAADPATRRIELERVG